MNINLGDTEGLSTPGNVMVQLIVFAVTIAATFLICVYFLMALNKEVKLAQNELSKIDAEIQANSALKKKRDDYNKQKEELKRKNDAIAVLESQQSGPVQLLAELSDLVSSRIYFTAVELKGLHLQIIGKAIDNIVLSDFMTRLDNSKFFVSVNLVQIKHEVLETVECMEFIIEGVVQLPKYE